VKIGLPPQLDLLDTGRREDRDPPILQRPGFADADVLERAMWTTVTLD